MQKLLALLALTTWPWGVASRGQGQLSFNNRVLPEIDARVTFLDGNPVSNGFTAQLYGGLAGASISELKPLLPPTTFRTAPQAALGYIVPVDVVVPGVGWGQTGTFQMRVFEGTSWETSARRGESNILAANTGNPLGPGGYLFGLQSFHVAPVPEPSPAALFVVGVVLICFSRRAIFNRRSNP